MILFRFSFIALGLEATLISVVLLGHPYHRIATFWSAIFVAFCLYLLAARSVWRGVQWKPAWILVTAIIFRLTLLAFEPTLSDDIYRYIWDGRVQLAGFNPYLYSPDSEALLSLRNELWEKINHRHIPTIYPPLSQILFRIVCTISPTVLAMKTVFTVFDCATILLLVKVLRSRGEDPQRVLLYAWNPLPILEVAGNGHLDSLGVFLTILALYAVVQRRRVTAAWALAGAFAAKLLPLLVLPVLWRHAADRWNEWRFRLPLLWFPVVAGFLLLLFADAGRDTMSGLQIFFAKWRFNDGIFSLVYTIVKEPGFEPDDVALKDAKIICGVLLTCVLVWAFCSQPDPFRAAATVIGANLLLSPVLHPWYLLWALPFLVLFPSPAWVFLSAAAFISYNAAANQSVTGVWMEETWVKWVQFLPFYLLTLAYTVHRHFQRRLSKDC